MDEPSVWTNVHVEHVSMRGRLIAAVMHTDAVRDNRGIDWDDAATIVDALLEALETPDEGMRSAAIFRGDAVETYVSVIRSIRTP